MAEEVNKAPVAQDNHESVVSKDYPPAKKKLTRARRVCIACKKTRARCEPHADGSSAECLRCTRIGFLCVFPEKHFGASGGGYFAAQKQSGAPEAQKSGGAPGAGYPAAQMGPGALGAGKPPAKNHSGAPGAPAAQKCVDVLAAARPERAFGAAGDQPALRLTAFDPLSLAQAKSMHLMAATRCDSVAMIHAIIRARASGKSASLISPQPCH